MNFKNITKYRYVWMALSIILIFLYHLEISTNNQLLLKIFSVGYMGVDIFMFSTGLGLYFSYKNSSSLR